MQKFKICMNKIIPFAFAEHTLAEINQACVYVWVCGLGMNVHFNSNVKFMRIKLCCRNRCYFLCRCHYKINIAIEIFYKRGKKQLKVLGFFQWYDRHNGKRFHTHFLSYLSDYILFFWIYLYLSHNVWFWAVFFT